MVVASTVLELGESDRAERVEEKVEREAELERVGKGSVEEGRRTMWLAGRRIMKWQ